MRKSKIMELAKAESEKAGRDTAKDAQPDRQLLVMFYSARLGSCDWSRSLMPPRQQCEMALQDAEIALAVWNERYGQ